MSPEALAELLESLRRGELEVADALARLEADPSPRTVTVPEAAVDVDRARRCGFPEVVYAEGKTPETVRTICRTLVERHGTAFVTRANREHAAEVVSEFESTEHNAVARTLRIGGCDPVPAARVAVVSAGTTDRAVAEEAVETVQWMGIETSLVVDVGVAGPYRLAERMDRIAGADAVVVVAGMEGALPSIVGGWLACPVIAVPTSVGYGANFGGLAALLGMLNSCAANVTVVNIDAGFKGGYVAGLIASRAHRGPNDSA